MENKLRNFLLVSKFFTKPGFAKVLGTEPESLLKSLQYFHEHNGNGNDNGDCDGTGAESLLMRYDETHFAHTFRYKIPSHACVSRKHSTTPAYKVLPLSGYFALFDDFTTLAIATEDRKTRPGVSISLAAHLGSQYRSEGNLDLPQDGDDVDFKIRVTKIGNVFGFAQGKAVCCKTGQVVAYGNHVKYLPGSIVSEFILGRILTLSAWVVTKLGSRLRGADDQGDVDDDIEIDNVLDLGTDNFSETNKKIRLAIQKVHHNPWGTLHGGCQAMMMESVVNMKMHQLLGADDKNYYLDEMQIQYMSVGKKEVTFTADVIDNVDNHDSTTRVHVKALTKEGKSISEGLLTFRKCETLRSHL